MQSAVCLQACTVVQRIQAIPAYKAGNGGRYSIHVMRQRACAMQQDISRRSGSDVLNERERWRRPRGRVQNPRQYGHALKKDTSRRSGRDSLNERKRQRGGARLQDGVLIEVDEFVQVEHDGLEEPAHIRRARQQPRQAPHERRLHQPAVRHTAYMHKRLELPQERA
jgi:hypothetical protein